MGLAKARILPERLQSGWHGIWRAERCRMDRRMDREMDDKGIETKLDALFAEYRSACPDPDADVNFLPNLWQKIEARRNESVSVFRRWAQVCVLATAALTVAMAILIPHIQT